MALVKLIFVSMMVSCSTKLVSAFFQPIAQINNSRIIGQTVNFTGIPVNQYLGIPFAQPPLKELRFQKPKPIESYPAEFKAQTNPPSCLQYLHSFFPWVVRSGNTSEDCLYLNIWAPFAAGRYNKKAVLFWVHGGDFRSGSIVFPVYDGSRLAALGDIIVVTVNYRLSYFGFFTSNTTDAPGNVGIWDILESLKWVNKYISAFGGDPSKITIAGWDAGATAVGLLSVSPLAQGLYARQIMQSGSPVYRRADNNTQNLMLSQKLAYSVGCASKTETIYNSPKKVVECMQKEDAYWVKIQDSQFSIDVSYFLVPEFGDEILPENPRLSVINNNFRCTDLLIGNVEDEGAYALSGIEFRDYPTKDNENLNRSSGEAIIRKSVSYFPDPEAIVSYYLPPTIQDDTDHQIRHQAFTAFGDTVYTCPAVYYADKCAEQRKNVYYYYFNHHPSVSIWNAPWINVSHFDDVLFVFGWPLLRQYTLAEKTLSHQIINIWTYFVRYGRPSVPFWPAYSKENPVFKYIGPDYVTYANGKGPQAKNCGFLKPHFGF